MTPPTRRSNAWIFVVVAVVLGAAVVAAMVFGVRRFEQQREAREADQRELAIRLTPTSTADATTDLVDADYLVTLKWPGTGFKLMSEADAKRLGSDAIAVAMHEGGCSISVVAEQIPDATPEIVARRLIDGTLAQKKSEQIFEKATFHGFPAQHYKISGEMTGVAYHFDNIVVARGNWFFQVLRTEAALRAGSCDIPLETLVTFQEGTIKGRTPVVLPTEANRPLYREKNGLYESPTFAVRMQAPAGAQLMVGDEAVGFDSQAAFVVVEKSDSVAVTTQPLCGDPGPAYLAGQNAATATQFSLTLPEKHTHSVKVGGQTLELYEITGPAPYTTMLGSAVFGERLLMLRATYSKHNESTGIELVQRTVSGLTMLDQPAADAVARELPTRDSARVVRLGRSLRAGQYVDYRHGLRADLGDEPTHTNLELEPGPLAAKAVLAIGRPRFGIDSLITIASTTSGELAADHKALAASMLGVTEADLTVEPGGGPKNTKIGYNTQIGVKGRVDISTVQSGSTNVHVATWGTKSCVERAATSTAKLVGGVKLEQSPIAEAELTPRKVKSARFGFELLLPEGDWKQSEMTLPPAVAGVMTGYEFRDGGNLIGVIAIHNEKTPDQEFIVGLLEQLFASKIGKQREKLERADHRVSGIMGRLLKWSDKISAVLVADGGTYFVVMVEKAPLSSLEPGKVFSGFAITP